MRILEEMVFAEAVMLDEVREVTTVFLVADQLQVFKECVPERRGLQWLIIVQLCQ